MFEQALKLEGHGAALAMVDKSQHIQAAGGLADGEAVAVFITQARRKSHVVKFTDILRNVTEILAAEA